MSYVLYGITKTTVLRPFFLKDHEKFGDDITLAVQQLEQLL